MTAEPNLNLAGKVVFITGGAGDIGGTIVRAFAAQQAKIIIADLNLERAEELAAELKPADVYACQMDVTSEDDIKAAVAFALKQFGRIDVLTNVAGILCRKPFFETTLEDIEGSFGVNVKGLFLVSREVGRVMQDQRQGAIVNISSMNSKMAVECRSVYGATKAAVNALTQAMAVELAPFNITVNAVAPGIVDSKMARVRLNTPELVKKFTDCIPLGKMTLPEDVANGVLFLSSPLAKNISGQIVTMDGGLTVRMGLPKP